MRRTLSYIFALSLLLCSCSGDDKGEKFVRSVSVVEAESAEGGAIRSLPGIVKEKAEIDVAFLTPGQLSHIYVREGQHVARGSVIATLDSRDYKLGVEAAETQYNQLAAELERMKPLYEAGNVTPNDYAKAEAGVRQLRVQLQSNRNKLSYTVLRAPADGIVKSVNFEASEMVDAGTPVISLLSSGAARVEVNVPAWVYRHRADIASIHVVGEGIDTPARVMAMIPKADASQLYKAILAVDDTRGLVAGSNVTVDFSMKSSAATGGVIIPTTAVVSIDGIDKVWVVRDDSTVTARQVSLSPAPVDGCLAVESGIDPGETVVRAGARHLKEGEKVTIVKPASDTNFGELL